MRSSAVTAFAALSSLPLLTAAWPLHSRANCRAVAGSSGWPSASAWSDFNTLVNGHLVESVPMAKYCLSKPAGVCTDAEWSGGFSRAVVPGAACYSNWEYDWDASPMGTCFRDSTLQTCSQGNVAVYALVAESVEEVQAAIKFANDNYLRLSVKSSGHDMLGRSSAKGSFQINTQKFQSIQFHDSFTVDGEDLGSAVTIGSGVGLYTAVQAAKAVGKTIVAGTAASVSAGAGWFQAGGHGSVSTKLGMGADNLLQATIVLANGDYVTLNKKENTDLYWAIRGGGPGTWGVIISATFQTYPSFTLALVNMDIYMPTTDLAATIGTIHAEHIFELESIQASEYLLGYAEKDDAGADRFHLNILSYLPEKTADEGTAFLADRTAAFEAVEGVTVSQTAVVINVNDGGSVDDVTGYNAVVGSRLIPSSAYQSNPEGKGQLVKELLEAAKEFQDTLADSAAVSYFFDMNILGGAVAGYTGDNALMSAWRTAKTHTGVVNQFPDTTSSSTYNYATHYFQTAQLPSFLAYAGTDSKGYSSENDVFNEDFIDVYYGEKYEQLTEVKGKYDSEDLFIVPTGVGAERWDVDGIFFIAWILFHTTTTLFQHGTHPVVELIPRGATVYAIGFFLTDEEIMALAQYHPVHAGALEAGGPYFALDQMFCRKGHHLKTLWTSYQYYDQVHPTPKTKGYSFLVIKIRVGWEDEPEPLVYKSRFTEEMLDEVFSKGFRETKGRGPKMGFTFEEMKGRLACMPWPHEDRQCLPSYVFTQLREEAEKKKAKFNPVVLRAELSGEASPSGNA